MADANLGKTNKSRKFIDITGERFGRLLALSVCGQNKRRAYKWLCVCDCGTELSVLGTQLRSGQTKSCGCLQKEMVGSRKRTHGMSNSTTYKTWTTMINRCTNENDPHFKHYGGRGITVCGSWIKFENFLADMGKRPDGRSLDRIDNSKGYSKENCRWATTNQQRRNTRRTNFLTLNGETKSVSDWCEELSLNRYKVRYRLENGWPAEKVLHQGQYKPGRKPKGERL